MSIPVVIWERLFPWQNDMLIPRNWQEPGNLFFQTTLRVFISEKSSWLSSCKWNCASLLPPDRGSCCSLKSYFAVGTLSSRDFSFVFPSYRRKGNKVSVEILRHELLLHLDVLWLDAALVSKKGFWRLSLALQIKQGESRDLFVKINFSAFFSTNKQVCTIELQFCKHWAKSNDILKLLAICPNSIRYNSLAVSGGKSCTTAGTGLSFGKTLPFLSGGCLDWHFFSNTCIWQVNMKSWRKIVLLAWKSVRYQMLGKVGNTINKGRGAPIQAI